ncbi:MAG: hypothetical protein EXQ94_01440 [Alphaproteobacteria bacterium]|nr:hypothetical protein [Alphaproteobacteria bacterium]
MLRALRRSAGTWFVRAFLGLLALAFGVGIWGDPGSLLRSQSGTFLAAVGGVEIDPQTFSREFQRDTNRARSLLGDAFDNDPELKAQVARGTIDRMAMGLQFAQDAERLGLAVSDELLAKAIVDNPSFHDDTGTFSQDIFIGRIANQGFNEQGFVALLRGEILRQQIAGGIAGAAAAPELLLDRLFSFQNEARVAEYAMIAAADMPLAKEPAEGDLKAFHEAHADRYTAPEYRGGVYVLIDPTDLADEVAADENEVLALFEERAAAMSTPERRTVEQILLPDKAGASAAKAKVDAGEDFLAVATSLGQGAAVSLGVMTRDDFFSPALADAAFGTDLGDPTAPAQSPLGWHVFRVTAIEPARQVTLADVRPAIELELKLSAAADAAYEIANSLEDILAGGATLVEAADQLELAVRPIPAIDRDGVAADGTATTLPEITLIDSLFATAEGELSPLRETTAGGFGIVQVGSIVPSAVRPFDSVRGDVDTDWRAAERDRAAADAADAAAIKLAAGAAFAEAVGPAGIKTTAPFRRDPGPSDAPFPPDLVDNLFAAKVGDVVTAAANDGSGHIVARLARIDAVDTASVQGGIVELRKALNEQIRADILEQYRVILQERYPVEIDATVLDALL